jgi:hypothetical protein
MFKKKDVRTRNLAITEQCCKKGGGGGRLVAAGGRGRGLGGAGGTAAAGAPVCAARGAVLRPGGRRALLCARTVTLWIYVVRVRGRSRCICYLKLLRMVSNTRCDIILYSGASCKTPPPPPPWYLARTHMPMRLYNEQCSKPSSTEFVPCR